MSTNVFKQRKDIDGAFKALSQCIHSDIPHSSYVFRNVKQSTVLWWPAWREWTSEHVVLISAAYLQFWLEFTGNRTSSSKYYVSNKIFNFLMQPVYKMYNSVLSCDLLPIQNSHKCKWSIFKSLLQIIELIWSI